MPFRRLSLAFALLVVPIAVRAQPFQGLYIGAGAGYNLPENYPVGGSRQLEPQGGIVALGSVGYALLYPIVVPAVMFLIAVFVMPETRKHSIWEEGAIEAARTAARARG